MARFQALLRELFQFDCADLDFGIYRIMNHKRDVVERFITTKLPETIDKELDSGTLARQAQANAALARAREQVEKTLGTGAIDPTGAVAPALAETPVAQTYLDAKARAAGTRSRAALEADTYNHLHTFFGRYYQDGDFVSKRRYSRNHRYAIPYNGEEVYLHWANSDQYYIKTAEHFHSYQWKSPTGVTVHFRVDSADVEQNNVKGERRFFVPRTADADWDAASRTLTLPFTYRPLSATEQATYGRSNQQDKIIAAALEELPRRFRDPDALATLTSERRRRADNGPVTHLEHHLLQYTRRNDSDFFIHRDLRGFLARELDFYLKNEVLNLDDLSAAGEHAAEGWFQLLQLIRSIGGQIIDFLAQIEEFQKTLWEKRKLVTETNYCVAMRCIPSVFYPEIVANDAQWAEWRDLAFLNSATTSLFDACTTPDQRVNYVQMHGTMMLDTAHFPVDFTDRLLSVFDDLDGATDGLLLNSDNWHALRLLQWKYARRVKCLYIDPPYNTDASAILYKNGYKDSSWLSLMASGLGMSKGLLSRDGVACCAIDDEEAWRLRSLMQTVFEHELGIVPVRSNPAGRKSRGQFSPSHEYAFFYGSVESQPGSLQKTEKELARYPLEDDQGRYAWNNLIRHGSGDRRADRPNMYYPIYVDDHDRLRVPAMKWNDQTRSYEILEDAAENETTVLPIRALDGQRLEKRWHRGPDRVGSGSDDYRVRRTDDGVEIDFKIRLDVQSMPKTWWDDKRYASANLGAKSIKDLFGDRIFDFAKAIGLVEDCLRASGCDEHAVVLDYFAGSGTTGDAVVNLNREDGGRRHFILVEMGEHFGTVVLPRMKKIAFTPEWADGKPVRPATADDAERSPRIIKYIRLESYEDALDSIQFDDHAAQLKLEDRIEGYLLNYLLKWETKDSATLLNPADLTSPFDYRLRVHTNGNTVDRPVDVAETFNYLLGLVVRTRRVHMDGDRRYLVFCGETREAPGLTTVVIWRDTKDWEEDDLKRDKAFVAKHGLMDGADAVYVNGLCAIDGTRPIEPLFKERMFTGVSDGT